MGGNGHGIWKTVPRGFCCWRCLCKKPAEIALRMPHIKIVLFLYFVLVLILVLVFLWTSPTCQRAHSCLSMPQIRHTHTHSHTDICAIWWRSHRCIDYRLYSQGSCKLRALTIKSWFVSFAAKALVQTGENSWKFMKMCACVCVLQGVKGTQEG